MILIENRINYFFQATRRFFARELSDGLSVWDCLDLMNLWFILIVISDTCAIIGSLMKMLIDVNVIEFQLCSCVLNLFCIYVFNNQRGTVGGGVV